MYINNILDKLIRKGEKGIARLKKGKRGRKKGAAPFLRFYYPSQIYMAVNGTFPFLNHP